MWPGTIKWVVNSLSYNEEHLIATHSVVMCMPRYTTKGTLKWIPLASDVNAGLFSDVPKLFVYFDNVGKWKCVGIMDYVRVFFW